MRREGKVEGAREGECGAWEGEGNYYLFSVIIMVREHVSDADSCILMLF